MTGDLVDWFQAETLAAVRATCTDCLALAEEHLTRDAVEDDLLAGYLEALTPVEREAALALVEAGRADLAVALFEGRVLDAASRVAMRRLAAAGVFKPAGHVWGVG